VLEKLLPVEALRADEESAADKGAVQVDYIYEQPKEKLLDKLLPRYIETQILRAMLESSAAEHAARMTAMESATKNAGDVIEALTLHMNKVRQAAITKEIIEIVSGASYGA
jgi:F-type H+-transporting ATPase subunit gamma